MFSRWGYPTKITHDGGPPYSSFKRKRYVENIGAEIDLCTPEHPQRNGIAERIMGNLFKVTYAAIIEG